MIKFITGLIFLCCVLPMQDIYPQAPGKVNWEFTTDGDVRSSPSIGPDGTIYFGSDDNMFYALNGKFGAKKWGYLTGGDVRPSPSIGVDGTVYVGSNDKKIYAFNGTTGNKKWEFLTGAAVYSSPSIGPDGSVYVGSGDNKVYSLDGITGDKKWEYLTGGSVGSSPSISDDGTVYVGSSDKKVYALNAIDGSKKWEYATGGYVKSSPAIGSNSAIYVGSADKKIYALDGITGTKKWEYLTGASVYSSPVIGSDGTVYIGSGDKKIYALDGTNGAIKWEYLTGTPVYSSPAIGSDGIVYLACDKNVYALDGITGLEKWVFKTRQAFNTSPLIGHTGIIYVGSDDNNLYALTSTSQGPNDSPWPMFGKNARRTSSTLKVPDIISQPQKYITYLGSQVEFVVEAEGTGPFKYLWYKNGQPIAGANEQKLIINEVRKEDYAIYSVWVKNNIGEALSHLVELLPPTMPKISLTPINQNDFPFTFSFPATEGESYEIQVTQDLKDWGKLGEVNGISGEVKYTDLRQPIDSHELNFYRVRLIVGPTTISLKAQTPVGLP